jgi:hypothetical protein
VLAENLDALKCGGWGVFIAPTTKVAVGEDCCRRAHRIVRCASHVTQPLGFDLWSSDRWATGQSGGAPDSHCSLFGAPSSACSDFCVRSPHCSLLLYTFAVDRWRCSCCSAWHTGQSSATPDSPVNYSEVAPQIPEVEQFRVDLPGVPDTIRWHTGQSGAPDQDNLQLVLLLSI